MQTRSKSLQEVVINVGTGFVISYVLLITLIPALFVDPTAPGSALGVTCVYTVASVLRGYVVRRFYNRREKNENV